MRAASTTRAASIAALALFSFVFLGSEFCFDTCIGAFLSPTEVVWAQNIGLGISAAGFIAFGLLAHFAKQKHLHVITFTGTAVICACLVLVEQSTAEPVVRTAGYIAFFLLGCAGAAAHWRVAQILGTDNALARTVGIAYAAGILLQFLNNQFVPIGLAETIVLCTGVLALVVAIASMGKARVASSPATSARKQSNDMASNTSNPAVIVKATAQAQVADHFAANTTNAVSDTRPSQPQPLKPALWAIALVMLLACLFSTLDNVVTIANAQGSVNVEQWPRLFLAASGIAAGFVFDIDRRRYMGLAMFCVSLLSTCSILATEAGISPLVGLITFYLGSGCFVVFFTTTFIALAPNMKMPALWAGMGRAANNVCALVLSGASLALVQSGDAVLTMFATVILFALTSVAIVASGLLVLPGTAQVIARPTARESASTTDNKPSANQSITVIIQPDNAAAQQQPTLTSEQRLTAFAKRYNLTPRETDVLQAISANDRPLKQVADDLGISLRMVQRHLTSLYQKTGTQTRTGLAMKYLEEK